MRPIALRNSDFPQLSEAVVTIVSRRKRLFLLPAGCQKLIFCSWYLMLLLFTGQLCIVAVHAQSEAAAGEVLELQLRTAISAVSISAVSSSVSARTDEPCQVGQACEECLYWPKPGDRCATSATFTTFYCNPITKSLDVDASSFVVCSTEGFLEKAHCAPETFFVTNVGCVSQTSRTVMQHRTIMRHSAITGSGRVGDACSFNTDCLTGMYCSGGLCACLSTYILREGYCYEKINPNQPGCTYDVQCAAVWPASRCLLDAGVGTCRCPETHVARETRDGWVCVSMRDQGTGATSPLYFICPLPDGAGFKIALNDPSPVLNSFPVACTTGSTNTVEGTSGVYGGGACIWPSTGEYVGDIYDCIATSPHVNLKDKFPQSNYAPSADGVCCPSRAFTCIQPLVTGGNPSEPRWWYNSVTGTCQQFLWDPSATLQRYHSANNFRTIEHCESYCRDTCGRGSPQYSTEAKVQTERPILGCSSSTACGNEYQCTPIGSQHMCCPTPNAVCNARGGRPFDLAPRATIYHPGFLTYTGKESIRFYYDPTVGKCSDFVYRGAGGNFNNFLSRHECEMFCARLQCDRGSPLRIGEDAQRCQNNAGCPSSHECKADQGVCCPRKQTICSQPLRVGDCTENVKRYWYNAGSRQCQMFEFTGCQGNDNNFETVLDCQSFCKNAIPEPRCPQGQAYKDTSGSFIQCAKSTQTCPQNFECYFDGQLWGCCPTKAYTCSLSVDNGVQCGAGSSFKYYYNVQTQTCESFQFNGCDGNSNNFPTRDSCEQYCGVGGCPNGGAPLRDHSGQISVCSVQENCPDTHECTPVFVTGSIIQRCCPSKKFICSQPPIQGSMCGSHSITRFYFNIVTAQCSPFQYNGCDGNQNNFVTFAQCNNFCMSNACAAGDSVYLNPNDQQPIMCNEALRNSCPPNYSCTFNSLMNNYVCCGAGSMGVCPEGEKAYSSATDSTPRECMINIESACPSNYLCRFNIHKNRYYCCTSVEGKRCPVGKFLYKDMHANMPLKCNVGNPSQCPEGYSCQSYLKGAFQGFCCSANTICPDNSDFFVDESSQQPRMCTMGNFISCPNGYVCKSSHSVTEGYCCRGNVKGITDGCPPGDFVHMVGGEIAYCDPFNPPNAPCPPGYTCQWSTANQRYQCCGAKVIPPPPRKSDGCPTAQIAFKDGDVIRLCTAGGQSCPAGYFCQFSSQNSQFQCCGVAAGCPDDRVAFIGMKGEPEQCVIGKSTCPFGFACLKSSTSEYSICCTQKHTPKDCEEDEVFIDGLCLVRSAPDEPCAATAQCTGGALCSDYVCRCPETTVLSGKYCQSANVQRCSTRQVQISGNCWDRVGIGKQCHYSRQCPLTSYCIANRCQCKTGFSERNGLCVENPEKEVARPVTVLGKPKAVSTSCLNPNLTPYWEPKSKRILACSPITDQCPVGYVCQMNSLKQQHICCGTPLPNVASTSIVCPAHRTPYLLNGIPQNCVNLKCAQGYECVFNGQDYYCCSSVNNRLSSSIRTRPPGFLLSNGCIRGRPLMFPSTQTPVACSQLRQCPIGYFCSKSTRSLQYICCTEFLNEEPMKNSDSECSASLEGDHDSTLFRCNATATTTTDAGVM